MLSSIRHFILPRVVELALSPTVMEARRQYAELIRRRRREEHTLRYFHDAADPYGYLLIQVLPALLRKYGVRLEPTVVSGPPAPFTPEPELRTRYSLADAAELARVYRLDFPEHPRWPSAALIERANALLTASAPSDDLVHLARTVGDALWTGDSAALAAIEARHPKADPVAARERLAEGRAELAHLGHYLGGMIHYGGEWYWGVDRLEALEDRLAGLGLARSSAPLLEQRWSPGPSEPPRLLPGERIKLTFFFSFRSPYSYIALPRTVDLARRYPVDLEIKPLLPMVMRGLPVPTAKRLYIVQDAAREARRHHVPFGRASDPVGRGAERCLAVYGYAKAQGRTLDYLLSAGRGIWSEGVNVASDRGLRLIIERAGLSWRDALPYLEDDSWRPWAEAHRAELFSLGLWGVPSYHMDGYVAWGQDRLWLIEEKMKHRTGSTDS